MGATLLLLVLLEGLLFDPVYSRKPRAGMIDRLRHWYFSAGQNIVLIHTGGSAGLFGNLDDIL